MEKTKMDELKIRAYDLIAFIEQAQAELKAVNQAIAELFQAEQAAKAEKPKETAKK